MIPTRDKIKTLEELVILRRQWRQDNKTVVTTNGSYDILHAGHVRSLEESRAQGDVLVVGINSDSSVKQYKSPNRPIISERERAEMVAGLECVDYVFIFNELNPIDFINQLKPDIHTNSVDYGENCVERNAVINNGGKIYLLKKNHGISTSLIIKKILEIEGKI